MRRVRVAVPGQRIVQPHVLTALEMVRLLRNEHPAGGTLVDGHEHDVVRDAPLASDPEQRVQIKRFLRPPSTRQDADHRRKNGEASADDKRA
jgi:hypothetical protein